MFVDAEDAVRTWLNAAKNELSHQGAFFKMPEADVRYPIIVVTRIGGSPQIGQTPIEDARLSLSVWGATKKQAADVTQSLTAKLFAASNVALSTNVLCYGFSVNNVIWLPDDNVQKARYVVEVTASLRAVA